MKRILAILTLCLIAILLVLLLVFAFTGAKTEYLLALLFSIVIVPAVVYILIWFTNLMKK